MEGHTVVLSLLSCLNWPSHRVDRNAPKAAQRMRDIPLLKWKPDALGNLLFAAFTRQTRTNAIHLIMEAKNLWQ